MKGELAVVALCLAAALFGYFHGRHECPAPIVITLGPDSSGQGGLNPAPQKE
jgi:hypothetical protein